jgi:hypothetical protein
MTRYLGATCEKCGKIFPIGKIVGPLPTFDPSVYVLATCHYCQQESLTLADSLVALEGPPTGHSLNE